MTNIGVLQKEKCERIYWKTKDGKRHWRNEIKNIPYPYFVNLVVSKQNGTNTWPNRSVHENTFELFKKMYPEIIVSAERYDINISHKEILVGWYQCTPATLIQGKSNDKKKITLFCEEISNFIKRFGQLFNQRHDKDSLLLSFPPGIHDFESYDTNLIREFFPYEMQIKSTFLFSYPTFKDLGGGSVYCPYISSGDLSANTIRFRTETDRILAIMMMD